MDITIKSYWYIKLILGILILWSTDADAQNWKPAMEGLYPIQIGGSGTGFNIKFRANGPMGKDWIYGGFRDNDSIRRCVAYRDGGRWVSLPFSGYKTNIARDIGIHGDTLYMIGSFSFIVKDDDTVSDLINTGILKWYNDSLWGDTSQIWGAHDMDVKGDTLLLAGVNYYPSPNVNFTQLMSIDAGRSWQYPYNIIHPTESIPDFGGAFLKVKILSNGDILTINNGSPIGNPFRGISRWDGQQWHSFGNRITGSGYVTVEDFEHFRNELYIAGTFAKRLTFNGRTIGSFPQNPGNSIARWDGNQWHELAGGVLEGGLRDIFIYDTILYGHTFSGNEKFHQWGDVRIPYFAGWDGKQWCGTPAQYGNIAPASIGVIKDTLYVSFWQPGTINGDSVSYLAYYDDDYLHGPGSICSTPGLDVDENEYFPEEGFGIYPNPAADVITIVYPQNQPYISLNIFDLNGRSVFRNNFEFPAGLIEVDISALLNGMYIIEINGQHQKLMVR